MAREHHLELNPSKTLFYRTVAGLLRFLSGLLFRPRVSGAEFIPDEGPIIIAPTHRSNLDFAFSLFLSRRKIFFMAKQSLFDVPILGRVLVALGAFPVTRGAADRDAMKAAERVLHEGHALLMFPEGTRSEGSEILPLHDGAMFVAARTRARVVPVGIAGSEVALAPGAKMVRPHRVDIVIGSPIEPPTGEGRPTRAQITEKTAELQERLHTAFRDARERNDAQ
ncbi:MAG: 1-acyl-sn-glycerol-3-phosphate acyltransferase [Acidimicrobiaceae bacterium]|nr:1-acyl-sn-glycerol-3-phosphate acyltransferase [Acidimicrobiaceae bacterium]